MDIEACLARINELADRHEAGTADMDEVVELIGAVEAAQTWQARGGWVPDNYGATMARPAARLARG